MMAAVVLNLSGLLSGLLHLFLRSNTSSTSFGPKIGSAWDQRRHEIRIFGPNELTFYNPLLDPVPGPSSVDLGPHRQLKDLSREVSPFETDIDGEKGFQYAKPTSNSDGLLDKNLTPLAAKAFSPASYSLFPPQDFHNYSDSVPVHEIADLDLPRPIFARNSRQIRNSSESSVTSATLQIGLRLSHVMTNPSDEYDDGAFLLPATTYKGVDDASLSPQVFHTNRYSDFQRDIAAANLSKLETTHASPTTNGRNLLRPPTFTPISSKKYYNQSSNENRIGITAKNHSLNSPSLSLSESIKSPGIRLSPAVYKPMEKPSSPEEGPEIVTTLAGSIGFRRSSSPRDAKELPPMQKANWI